MSGQNQKRRGHSQSSAFPFRFLHCWIKPLPSGLFYPCQCGNEACYAVMFFFDVENIMCSLKTFGKSQQEIYDAAWEKAVTEQMQGRYTIGHIIYNCQRCACALLACCVGDDVAMLVSMPMVLTRDSSVIVGATLLSREDEGKRFAGVSYAETVDKLIEQLKGEVIPIHLANR